MSTRYSKDGFTLVEILVAMAIIVAVLSMIYGSYFAISKSTQNYKARMALFQQGRKVLGRMARQIRCSYADSAHKPTDSAQASSRKTKAIAENTISYFNANPDDPAGEILHLVTTSGISYRQDQPYGLLDAAYKFNKTTGTLLLSQTRFVHTPKSGSDGLEKRNWHPIAKNIDRIELTFFDGQKWLPKWDFKQKKELPRAVKIEITCENENYQQYHYRTIAYVCCWKNQAKKTPSDTLVSVNKQ